MTISTAILAPLALLLASNVPAVGGDVGSVRGAVCQRPAGLLETQPGTFLPTDRFGPRDRSEQVRIRQRVILRISPRKQAPRSDLVPMPAASTQLKERSHKGCVKADDIAALATDRSNRVVFFMGDRTLVGASLEDGCRARDFYSGAYVEKSGDGLLCPGRDRIQARGGAKCLVSGLVRLIPAG